MWTAVIADIFMEFVQTDFSDYNRPLLMRLVKLQPDVRRCYWVFRSPAFEREKKRKALVSQTISWAV